ncbi:growth-regulating factor 1-like isoform X2 [Cornus florida]|uniref:growth-regulating factor 1-like isoform X2 n=1 Tax=Cornus florida TaxID=4283 RepID=UPI0028A02B43|nr:growth-regulating factor 1-like isoform X2 [Cornus florida]
MSARNRLPFTPSQWQELEHQALIFRYMVSGVPIPSDLLFTIKRSLDSPLSPKLILQEPQHIGWNCFQMGFGRKIDPEPWRCRRTDGKKWRCSKEAYPDSKYCERHMHRGRNRSRKPVEVVNTTTTNTAATINSLNTYPPTIPISSITRNPPINPSTFTQSTTNSHLHSSLSSIPSNTHHYLHNHPCYTNTTTQIHHPYLYDSHSSSRHPGIGLSSYDNASDLLLDSGLSSHADKDYRYGDGMKEGVDEHALFSEASGTMTSYSGSSKNDSWQLTPLTMGSSLTHLKQRSYSGLQNGCLNLQVQGLTDASNQQKHDQQHFYGLGSHDVKCEMSLKIERDDEPQKVMHHFLDEWPPRNKDSWLDSDEKSSTTQLSISIPNSSHDFFMNHNDK